MPDITIHYTDGTTELFPDTSRPGGSYCTTGKADGAFYIITEAWGNSIAIPAERIKKVEVKSYRY